MTDRRPVGVVTGGTHGIGRHAAEALAADGWAVALCSRHGAEAEAAAAELEASHRVPAYGAAADVCSASEVARFADRVVRQLGPPDAVLANAGVPGPVGPLHVVDLPAWAAAVAVDLVGVANTFASFARPMVEQGRGSLIAMSGGGVGGPGMVTRMSAYTCSKAAVLALVETLAGELADHSVRVNAIAPGAIRTRFMKPVLDAGPGLAGPQLHQQAAAQQEHPNSIEGFVALLRLLVDPEGPFITGRVLSARWDAPELLRHQPLSPDSSMFRLRRIDGVLYGELLPGA